MEGFFKDLTYAWRGLRRSPGMTFIAGAALALGIGLTTVMFSITYGALHRGLPFPGAERLMHLARANPSQGINQMQVTIHDFRDWEARQRSFEELGAFYQGTVNIRGTERPERYSGAFMTANAFRIVGVQPVLGRAFTPEEELPGAPQVVVLGHRVWQERFGGSPDVLGASVTVNGEAGTVIGVMPEGFEFPVLEEVWVPLRLDPVALPRGDGTTLAVFGKLREGISLDAAMAEFSGITAQLAGEHPETNEGVTALIVPYASRFIGDEAEGILTAMLLSVILVLLIACANVANLLLARAATRTRDLAVPTAMGAHRWRVVTQVLAEALVIALAGAVAGTVIAWAGITLFDRAVQPTDPPFWLVFKLDAPIFAFVLAVTGLAAVAAGILPALKASRSDVNAILKDESRGSSSLAIGRLSRVLVMGEVAMSMALLVASALMMKGVLTLNAEEYPFPTEDVFTARVGIFEERFPEPADRLLFWEDVERRVAAIPGVRSAALTQTLPGLGSPSNRFSVEGESYAAEQDLPRTHMVVATPSFGETFGLEPLRGRWLEEADDAGATPVAVVNQRFADRFLPGTDAVGRRIRLGGLESDEAWVEIVGVVPNHRVEGVGNVEPGEETDQPGIYLPLAQQDARFLSIAARAEGVAPLSLAGAVREAVAAVDADTPLYYERTLRAAMDQNLWFYRVFGTLFLVFGLAALFLASVGLYGVMSFSVTQRTGEMGIRMALGAQGGQVLRMILRQGLRQILIGVAVGSLLALVVARGLAFVLYQVEPWDPGTFTAVLVLLALTGMGASLVPALRATRVDPGVALRND